MPPFTWRDLYVYVTAAETDITEAVLRYRVGDSPEKEVRATRYPWEFSAPIDTMEGPIRWRVDVRTPDGAWHRGEEK